MKKSIGERSITAETKIIIDELVAKGWDRERVVLFLAAKIFDYLSNVNQEPKGEGNI